MDDPFEKSWVIFFKPVKIMKKLSNSVMEYYKIYEICNVLYLICERFLGNLIFSGLYIAVNSL